MDLFQGRCIDVLLAPTTQSRKTVGVVTMQVGFWRVCPAIAGTVPPSQPPLFGPTDGLADRCGTSLSEQDRTRRSVAANCQRNKTIRRLAASWGRRGCVSGRGGPRSPAISEKIVQRPLLFTELIRAPATSPIGPSWWKGSPIDDRIGSNPHRPASKGGGPGFQNVFTIFSRQECQVDGGWY